MEVVLSLSDVESMTNEKLRLLILKYLDDKPQFTKTIYAYVNMLKSFENLTVTIQEQSGVLCTK